MKHMRDIAGPATKRVLSDKNYRRFIGTAFTINRQAVLTSRHVVQNAPQDVVIDGDDLGDIGRLDWSIHEDPDRDVAIGFTQGSTFSYWLTPVCVDIAERGEAVVCMGYGANNQGVISWREHVAGQLHSSGLVTLQNSISAGCSGGPVLNSDGLPVGITIARACDRAVKYVLPVRLFYAWIQEKGFRPAEFGRDEDEGGNWILMVPIRPPVGLHEVPGAVIEAFADTLHSVALARQHLATVNAVVLENNVERLDKRQITLQPADQPAFEVPRFFWSSVFSTLGMRSRRSVAALLQPETAPNSVVQNDETRKAFEGFKQFLINPD